MLVYHWGASLSRSESSPQAGRGVRQLTGDDTSPLQQTPAARCPRPSADGLTVGLEIREGPTVRTTLTVAPPMIFSAA